MVFVGSNHADTESAKPLLHSTNYSKDVPKDTFHLAYIIFFILGFSYLLPFNAFITAVDYFSYLYPDASVARMFSFGLSPGNVVCTFIIVLFFTKKFNVVFYTNVGLLLFALVLLVLPVMDVAYIKGRVGLDGGYYLTIVSVFITSVAMTFVSSGLIGSAGELPERYMQAAVSGSAGSGVLVCLLRILTKAVFPRDPNGLRRSAILYFIVGFVLMLICLLSFNIVIKLPVLKYYKEKKLQAANEEEEQFGAVAGKVWRSTIWNIVKRVKLYGIGIILVHVVTMSIFPGCMTEDVHSEFLQDWYPILLVACYNTSDLIGRTLPSVYILRNDKVVMGFCLARLLFFPVFYVCLYGPQMFRTEISIMLQTCLLGLSHGYFTCLLMILSPQVVPLQYKETAGIVSTLFLVVGISIASCVAWIWKIF